MLVKKKEYNRLLQRLELGRIYVGNPVTSEAERKKGNTLLASLLKRKEELLESIGSYSEEERQKGFVIDGWVSCQKERYNQLLLKYQEFEAYLNDKEIPEGKKEEHIPIFKVICETLSTILIDIKEYSQEEATKGFVLATEGD